MKVATRLILLAGAAAVIALLLRDALATRIARTLVEPARALAALTPSARAVAPAPSPTILPLLPTPSAPVVPPPPAKPLAKPAAPKPSASVKAHVVTRKEVEDAIANRLSGANAVLVKGADGKPLGLRLSGVSRLAPFGVQEGDILVSANGLPLRTADEAIAALGALKDEKHVVFSLRRGDIAYSVPLDLAESR